MVCGSVPGNSGRASLSSASMVRDADPLALLLIMFILGLSCVFFNGLSLIT